MVIGQFSTAAHPAQQSTRRINMRFRYIAALAAVIALPLGGCASQLAAVENAIGLGAGPTSAPVANSVQAAGHLFVGADKASDAFVKTSACDRTCRDKIAAASHMLRTYLDAALDAETKGDNAAMAVALKAFNDNYATLWSYLHGSGVSVPTS
jgi:hypothetical protein